MTTKRLTVTRGAVVGIAISWLAIVVAFGGLIKVQRDQSETAKRNRQAIVYICSTNTVLDTLVVSVAGQIEQNFKNGTYEKLHEQGVLSQANIEAAVRSLRDYRQAHARLSKDSPCVAVR